MMLKAFVVYDNKALNYGSPMFLKSEGEAIRAFADLANDKSTIVGKHPEDFVLFQIGTYSDEVGAFENFEPHKNYGLAASYVKPVVSPLSVVKEG